MTSILVVGNCHLYGMQRALHFFDSALRVEGCHVTELRRRFSDVDDLATYAAGFDHLLTMPFGSAEDAGFTVDDLVCRHASATIFPTVTFGAFHPDVVYIFRRDGSGAVLQSPLGPYHSALVYYGYLRGWTVRQTVSLFRPKVFERLGYLSTWEIAIKEIREAPSAMDFGLPEILMSAMRRGCFMHNPQHPKVGVITAIARTAMERLGLQLRHPDPLPFIPDDLVTSHVWPLYPAIASFYGLEGSYTFKRQSGVSRWPEFMTLEEFVQASHEVYGWQDGSLYQCARVDGWLRDGTGPEPG